MTAQDAVFAHHRHPRRVFRLLDPEAFATCFGRFVEALGEAGEGVVAIDGGSFDTAARRSPLSPTTGAPFPGLARWRARPGALRNTPERIGTDLGRTLAQGIDLTGRSGRGSGSPFFQIPI